VTGLVGELGHLPGVVNASNPLDPKAPAVAADQSAAYSTVVYETPPQEVTDAQRDALRHLRRGEADAGRGVHRLDHVVDERLDLGGDGRDRRRRGVQHAVPVLPDRTQRHA